MLCSLPSFLLEQIALEAALDDPLCPPSLIIPLLQSCRYIYHFLCFANAKDLYARIFKAKFDVAAPRRRFGPAALYSSNLATQLTRYCLALKRIRIADIYSPYILDDFWTAVIMMTENDGKNELQLQAAGLADFVERYVLERLWEDRMNYSQWPAETTINALALWLMWFTTDHQKLVSESSQNRKMIMDLIRPYILVSTRYPSFYAPDNHFNFPLPPYLRHNFQYSLLTPHGFWPLYRQPHDVTTDIPHFTGTITLAHPLITVAAKLLYLSRRELQPIQVPSSLLIDRATAIAQGKTAVFPTQADIHEFNRYKGSQFVDKGSWDEWKRGLTESELLSEQSGVWLPNLRSISSKWDPDWTRMMSCSDPWQHSRYRRAVHVFGVLDGLWHGRMLMPDETSYFGIASNSAFPAEFGEQFPFVTTVPVMVCLREHHCIRPMEPVEVPAGPDGREEERLFDEGVRNGWLPEWIKLRESGNTLGVQDKYGQQVATYETYRSDRPNSHSEDTCEVCIARIAVSEEAMLDRIEERRLDENSDTEGSDWEDVSMDVDGDGDSGTDIGSEDEEEEDPDIPEEFIESRCTGISDIIITGETLPRHGQAWHHYLFYGRIRPWDGLISLVRVPAHHPHLGVFIFRGYVHGGKNFVGTWCARTSNIHSVPMEGPFSLGKREDEPQSPVPSSAPA